MANTVIKRILFQGNPGKRVVVSVYIKGDGSGEETDTTIFDPAVDATPVMAAAAGLTVDQIWGNVQLFDVMLNYKGTTNTPIWLLNRVGGDSAIDFRSFGGIKDNTVAGANGKVVFSTTGLTAASTSGQATFYIVLRKD